MNRVVPAVVCAVRQGTVDAQGSATAAAKAMVQARALAAALVRVSVEARVAQSFAMGGGI